MIAADLAEQEAKWASYAAKDEQALEQARADLAMYEDRFARSSAMLAHIRAAQGKTQ